MQKNPKIPNNSIFILSGKTFFSTLACVRRHMFTRGGATSTQRNENLLILIQRRCQVSTLMSLCVYVRVWCATCTHNSWFRGFFSLSRRVETAAASSSPQLSSARCWRQLWGSGTFRRTTPSFNRQSTHTRMHAALYSGRSPPPALCRLPAPGPRKRAEGEAAAAAATSARHHGGAPSTCERPVHQRSHGTATYLTILYFTNRCFLFFAPLCPQVAKLRHQLQKRSRHAPPPSGCELLPHAALQAGHAAGVTQVTAPGCLLVSFFCH